MNIVCNHREDVLNRQFHLRDEFNSKKDKYNSQVREFYLKTQEEADKIEDEIAKEIGNSSIDIEINVEHESLLEGWRVHIKSYANDVHNSHKALSWNYDVSLSDEGEVKKETSSWSGLQATTEEQVESLKAVVRVLEILNTLDWQNLLSRAVPDYSEHVTEEYPDEHYLLDLDKELVEADLEDAIDLQAIVVGNGSKNWGYSYYQMIGETPKRFKVTQLESHEIYPESAKSDPAKLFEAVEHRGQDKQIDKDKFISMIRMPVEIITM